MTADSRAKCRESGSAFIVIDCGAGFTHGQLTDTEVRSGFMTFASVATYHRKTSESFIAYGLPDAT